MATPYEPPAWHDTIPAGKAGQLVVIKDGATVAELPLRSCTTFGRNSVASDVALDHSSLSRRHAAIVWGHTDQGVGYHAIDLGSSNGTTVNDKKLIPNTPHILHYGNIVKFGQSTRSYVLRPLQVSSDDAAAVAAALAPSPALKRKLDHADTEDDSKGDQDWQVAPPPKLPATAATDSDRKQREAEIAAAIASMDAPVTYTSYKAAGQEEEELPDAEFDEDNDDDDDDDADDDADGQRPFKHMQFGRGAQKAAAVPAVSHESKQDPAVVSAAAKALGLPITHTVSFGAFSKAVSAIALDNAGARMAVGSLDYGLKLYDFGGMNQTHQPFRSATPQDGYGIVSISYSPSGDQFVVATGSPKNVVYDRDAKQVVVTIRGDPYVLDKTKTVGHVAPNTCAQWNPVRKEQFLSSSLDGTVRTWDLGGRRSFDELLGLQVMQLKNRNGLPTGVMNACYSTDGRGFYCAEKSGSLQFFDYRVDGRYSRPNKVIWGAHQDGCATGMRFHHDGNLLATRGLDDTMKVWDVRKFTTAVMHFADLPNKYDCTNCIFNVAGTLLLTGISVKPGQGMGQVCVFDIRKAGATSPEYTMNVAAGASVVTVAWHERIQQIAVGCSDNSVHMYYDPSVSQKGILNAAGRAAKARDISDMINPLSISTPYDEDIRETREGELRRVRKDKKKSQMPEPPKPAPVVASTFAQQLARQTARDNIREQDPREQLLKYANRAAANPQWVNSAYKGTQPEHLLASKTLEEEEAEEAARRRAALQRNT